MHRTQKIIIIGGNAAGPSAAAKAKRVNPNAEVILFEAGHVGSDFVNNEMTLRINQFISLKIQHVHQLQNLYFAITGEELLDRVC
jgi:thioredoxin reductase